MKKFPKISNWYNIFIEIKEQSQEGIDGNWATETEKFSLWGILIENLSSRHTKTKEWVYVIT